MSDETKAPKQSTAKTVLQLIGAQLGIAFVAIIVPARVRLIGLFAVGFGIASGWATRSIIDGRNGRYGGRQRMLVAALLCIVGFCCMHAGLYFTYTSSIAKSNAIDPQTSLMNSFDASPSESIKAAMTQASEERQHAIGRLQSFTFYLDYRVKELQLYWPLSLVLFIGEGLAAVIAAAVMNRDSAGSIKPPDDNE